MWCLSVVGTDRHGRLGGQERIGGDERKSVEHIKRAIVAMAQLPEKLAEGGRLVLDGDEL